VSRVGNAPCSWGVLEFEASTGGASAAQVLDEIAATGYEGTELGDWGFLPTTPDALRAELAARRLELIGAFVPFALADAASHDAGIAAAVRTARLLAETVGVRRKRDRTAIAPVIVVADATIPGSGRARRAGRITPEDSLPPDAWTIVARGVESVARAVRDAAGLRTVFHHHCATWVEAPWEIATLVARTDPSLVGLCLDTGHLTYGGGDPLDLLDRFGDRVWHVHFKDCDAGIARRARQEDWDYQTALGRGLFCELGRGSVDFAAIRVSLAALGYKGWIVVEQDVLPTMGTPAESARRNRDYLRSVGL
jgi:inosose dehydratase